MQPIDVEGTTPSDPCPDCGLGQLFKDGPEPGQYVCGDCGLVFHLAIAPHEETCPDCERRLLECSHHGPPCRARLARLRPFLGERCAVLEAEAADDRWAQDRAQLGEV